MLNFKVLVKIAAKVILNVFEIISCCSIGQCRADCSLYLLIYALYDTMSYSLLKILQEGGKKPWLHLDSLKSAAMWLTLECLQESVLYLGTLSVTGEIDQYSHSNETVHVAALRRHIMCVCGSSSRFACVLASVWKCVCVCAGLRMCACQYASVTLQS